MGSRNTIEGGSNNYTHTASIDHGNESLLVNTSSSRVQKCFSLLKSRILMIGLFLAGLTGVLIGAITGLTTPVGLAIYLIGLAVIIINLVYILCINIIGIFDPIRESNFANPKRIALLPETYIKRNLNNILSMNVAGHSCVSKVSFLQFAMDSAYYRVSFKDNNYEYKINAFPCTLNEDSPSYIFRIHQSNKLSHQIIQNFQLNRLNVVEQNYERVTSDDGLSYDSIREQRLVGYQYLSEETSYLLSNEIIEQLSIFICATGGVPITWHNILINPDSPDKIYLSELDFKHVPREQIEISNIEHSLIGDECNRGLIHCLSSLDHINTAIKSVAKHMNCLDNFSQYRSAIQRRLDSLKRYQELCDRIDQLDYSTKKNMYNMVYKLEAKYLDLQNNKDAIVKLDTDNGDAMYFHISEFQRLLKRNADKCLDSNNQLIIPDNVCDYLQNHLLKIISNDPDIHEKVTFYDVKACKYFENACLFQLNDFPNLTFKVYKGIEGRTDPWFHKRDMLNKMAESSYDDTILVNNMLKKQNLNLLFQPKRNLLTLTVDGLVYKIIVSEVGHHNTDSKLNMGRLYESSHHKEALRELLKLLSSQSIYINAYNTILSDVSDGENRKLMLWDIEQDNYCNNIDNVLKLSASKDLLEELVIDCTDVFPSSLIDSPKKVKKYIDKCLSDASYQQLMYHRTKHFLNKSPFVSGNETLISVLDLLNQDVMSMQASADSLLQTYFVENNITSLTMKDAFREVLSEINSIFSQRDNISNIVIRRTITKDDIKNNRILNAYSNVYSNSKSHKSENIRLNWLQQIIAIMIANGYACQTFNEEGGFCL